MSVVVLNYGAQNYNSLVLLMPEFIVCVKSLVTINKILLNSVEILTEICLYDYFLKAFTNQI